MYVTINGKVNVLEAELSVKDLLFSLKLNLENVAVILNDRIIKKESFKEVKVKEGDKIDIFSALQGG